MLREAGSELGSGNLVVCRPLSQDDTDEDARLSRPVNPLELLARLPTLHDRGRTPSDPMDTHRSRADPWGRAYDRPSRSGSDCPEIQLLWPLCIASDLHRLDLTVHVSRSRNSVSKNSDGSSLSCPLPGIPPLCSLATANGEQLVQYPVLGDRVSFSFHAQEKEVGSVASQPCYASSERKTPEQSVPYPGSREQCNQSRFWAAGDLSLLHVFCTADRADEAGPAASLLCAPSDVKQELEALFYKIMVDLHSLRDTASNMTLRDVHGFSLLLGSRQSHNITDIMASGACSPNVDCSFKEFGQDGQKVITSVSGSAFNSPRAFAYDGTFHRSAPTDPSPLGPGCPMGDCMARRHSHADAASGKLSREDDDDTDVNNIKKDASACGLSHAPNFAHLSCDPDRVMAMQESYASATPWEKLGFSQQMMSRTWRHYLQPLIQDLSYLLTCLPGACWPETWEERTYVDTWLGVVEFLHHHSMWATIAAVFRHSEKSGFLIWLKGVPLSPSDMPADSLRDLISNFRPIDLVLQNWSKFQRKRSATGPAPKWKPGSFSLLPQGVAYAGGSEPSVIDLIGHAGLTRSSLGLSASHISASESNRTAADNMLDCISSDGEGSQEDWMFPDIQVCPPLNATSDLTDSSPESCANSSESSSRSSARRLSVSTGANFSKRHSTEMFKNSPHQSMDASMLDFMAGPSALRKADHTQPATQPSPSGFMSAFGLSMATHDFLFALFLSAMVTVACVCVRADAVPRELN